MRCLAALALTAGSLALGCGAPPKAVRAYAGAPRPANEVAVVRPSPGYLNVAAVRVDGIPVPVGSWIWQQTPDIELEPGTHTLTLALVRRTLADPDVRTLTYPQATFRAEAAHLYDLHAELIIGSFDGRHFAWRWWLVDTTTDSTVAESPWYAPGRGAGMI